MEESWHAGVFRSLSASLDGIVYKLISLLYQLFVDLAKIDILNDKTIATFYGKIYVLLGLFMFFKISFSFINYVVNPDMFSDNKVGAKKMMINVVLSLIMLSLAPFAFSFLSTTQYAILEDEVIPKFFLGAEDGETEKEYKFYISDVCNPDLSVSEEWPSTIDLKPVKIPKKDKGTYISLLVFRPFFQIDEDFHDKVNKKYSVDAKFANLYCFATKDNNVGFYLHTSIYNEADDVPEVNLRDADDEVEKYFVDYKILILSTVCGVVVVLLLLTFCFDIAIRSIKLGFLELIAPIPIISYMDPKSAKNGMFKKWLKEVGSTWVDLFIRQLSVFLAVFIISLLDANSINFNGAQTPKFWLMIFIIIGALMFAKKLPSLLENLIGIKFGGSLQFNPIKRVANEALGGKVLLGGAALGGAAALGASMNVGSRLFNGNTWKNKDGKVTFGSMIGGFGKTLTSGLGGLGSAGFRAAMMTGKDGKPFKGIWTGAQESNRARFMREENMRKAGVSTFGDRLQYMTDSVAADVQRLTGNMTAGQRDQVRVQERKKQLELDKKNFDLAKGQFEKEKNDALKPFNQYKEYSNRINNAVSNDSKVKEREARYNKLIEDGASQDTLKNYKKVVDKAKNDAFQKYMNSMEGQEVFKRATTASEKGNFTSDLSSYSNFKSSLKDVETAEYMRNLEFDDREARDIKPREKELKRIEREISAFETSPEYIRHQAANSDRTSKGVLQPGQQVSPNIGTITDNPYYSSMGHNMHDND